MNNRDPFFDNAKILLMLFVVLGHILSIGLKHKINVVVFEWIYTFHMPLFVFITGYFTKITNNKKYWQGLFRFIETFGIFTIIHVIISYLQGVTINIEKILTVPKFALWYLLSLIWWRVMLYFISSSIRENHKMLILLSISISLLMGWVPIDEEFSFQRTFAFLPFFVIGFVTGQKRTRLKIEKRRHLHLIFLLAIAMLYLVLPFSINVPLFQNLSYLHSAYSPIFYFVFRIGWLIMAGYMSYCFLSLVPQKEYCWTHFGQLTLFIYLYHSVILSWRYILRDTFHLPTSIIYCLVYFVVVLAVIWLMSKIRFFHWLLNPISSTINLIKKK